jgi:lipopolysaccharide export system protein LptC
MANPRVTLLDRLVSWTPVLLLGGLAALTYWLNAQVQEAGPRRDASARHDPDIYIENFGAVTFDANGRVLQSLAGKHAQHYPDDNSVDLTSPSLTVTETGKPKMSITADTGTVSGDRETVTLRGNVHAVSDGPPPGTTSKTESQGPTVFTTSTLRVVPKASRAETDQAVTIEDPRGIIHGVGMAFDNNAHTFKLKSAIRGTLQPKTLPK